ncbi:MAG TPA: hypothetical protein VF553_18790 [Pyrinomonadaceae bacterium]|jgi:hypothetical protein
MLNARCEIPAVVALALIVSIGEVYGQQAGTTPPLNSSTAASRSTQNAPALVEWKDNFDGNSLDEQSWERFTMEGGSGKVQVEKGQLRMRGMDKSRAGVRSRQMFSSDRFLFEATLAKVGPEMPTVGNQAPPLGRAILAVLFDGSDRNRLEWILTSEGTFEAWAIIDGRGERLDNHKLGTRITSPKLAIARRGDEFFFMGNDEIAFQKTLKNMPRSFRVMLYGYSSSANDWDAVRVVTARQP